MRSCGALVAAALVAVALALGASYSAALAWRLTERTAERVHPAPVQPVDVRAPGAQDYSSANPPQADFWAGMYLRTGAACATRRQALEGWAWWQSGDWYLGPFGAPWVRLSKAGGSCIEERHSFDAVWFGLEEPLNRPGYIHQRPPAALGGLASVGLDFRAAVLASRPLGQLELRGLNWNVGPVGPAVWRVLFEAEGEGPVRMNFDLDEYVAVDGTDAEPAAVSAIWVGDSQCDEAERRWLPPGKDGAGHWVGEDRTALYYRRWVSRELRVVDVSEGSGPYLPYGGDSTHTYCVLTAWDW